MFKHPRPGSAVQEFFVKYRDLNGRYVPIVARPPPIHQNNPQWVGKSPAVTGIPGPLRGRQVGSRAL